MDKYLKILVLIVIIAAVSVLAYYLIISGYPYDSEDCTEGYFNAILILKGIIAVGAIIGVSIFSAFILKK